MNSYFDSVEKLRGYLVALASVPDGNHRPPGTLAVSHTFWRDYTCPPGCGGCCAAFTMDLWPDEYARLTVAYPALAGEFTPRPVRFFGRDETLYSNIAAARDRMQVRQKCQFLDGIGRCGIDAAKPFSCLFELNKLQMFPTRDRVLLSKKLFRNGWRYDRVDGGRGALCEMVAIAPATVETVIRRDLPLVERLVWLLDRYAVPHRGHALLALLAQQAETLRAGGTIAKVTSVT